MIDERDVEAKLVSAIRECGGMSLKLDSVNGIQDRLVLLPGARVYFIETKRPDGGKVGVLQRVRQVQIRRMGFPAYVICTIAEVEKFIEEVSRKTDKQEGDKEK